MTRRAFLIIVTIVSAIFGFGLLLIPGPFMTPYGLTLDPAGELMGRIAGQALVALGVIIWFVRDAAMSPTLLAVLYGGITFNVIGLIVVLRATLTGLVGSLGWMVIVLHVLLLAGFCYFAFERRRNLATK